jgi:hypothetical protein
MEKVSQKESETTLSMVTPILKLSKLQLRTLFATVLQKPMPQENEPLAPDDFHGLLVADLLMRLAFLEHEQRITILTEMRALFTANTAEFTQLVFADGNYCTWTGRTGFLDLNTGDSVTTLPMPPVETIGYNLNALYTRGKQQIAKRSRHGQKHDAGSVDKSGDLRDGPSDAVS